MSTTDYKILHLEETTSTNDFLKSYEPTSAITAVWADFQTAGRGQSGAWVSNRGENLVFSILLQPQSLHVSEAFILIQAMALALKETLDQWLDDVQIKWPNDIFSHDCKICGTLTENALQGKMVYRSVIGTGININQASFPEGLAAPASSIHLLTGKTLNPEEVLNSLIQHFQPHYEAIFNHNQAAIDIIRQRYFNSLYLKGIKHPFEDKDGKFVGTISHVKNSGHLVIIDEEGKERAYGFKEVKVMR